MKGTLAGPACTLSSTLRLSKPGTRCSVRARDHSSTSVSATPRQGGGRVGVRQASSRPARLTRAARGASRSSQRAVSRASPSRSMPGLVRRARQQSTASPRTSQMRISGSGNIESPCMNEGRTLTIPMVWFKEKGLAGRRRAMKSRSWAPAWAAARCHRERRWPSRIIDRTRR